VIKKGAAPPPRFVVPPLFSLPTADPGVPATLKRKSRGKEIGKKFSFLEMPGYLQHYTGIISIKPKSYDY